VRVNHESSAEIDAPAATVWDVYRDVARWSEWSASVDHAEPLDGPELTVGARFAIKQPRLPKTVWRVTEVEPGRSWSWQSKAPGVTTVGWHEVTALASGRTRARQGVEQRGWLAPAFGALTARLTERYLALEAAGLKARSEARHADIRSNSGRRPSS
jgi:uncharacterized membrane protein